jgi:uncharacterized protein YjbI with pentapeptide repeats
MFDGILRGIVTTIILLLCTAFSASADDDWFWRRGDDPDTVKRTRAELDSLLALHELWLDTTNSEGRPLILTNADLAGVNFEKANLRLAILDSANLSGAIMSSANLSFVSLIGAHLNRANLRSAKMHRVIVENADFSDADLTGAHMDTAWAKGARFLFANLERSTIMVSVLSKCDFRFASLDKSVFAVVAFDSSDFYGASIRDARCIMASFPNANLDSCDLSGTHFFEPDLTNAVFSVRELPEMAGLSNAHGLRNLRWRRLPDKIVLLRKSFSDLGLRQQEREVICALRRHDQHWLERLAFDFTSQWGSDLERPITIFLYLYLIASISYWLFTLFGRSSGIRVIEQRHVLVTAVITSPTSPSVNTKTVYYSIHMKDKTLEDVGHFALARWKRLKVIRLFGWSLFFAGLSAFNIGFRDINFGRWLRLLTRKHLDLQPYGWVRVVSGIQALLSVYLLALWILSWSGTPFK